MKLRVLVAGGGSGGHVSPGLAVLEALREEGMLAAAGWIGTARGIEVEILRHYPWVEFYPLPMRGFDRQRPWTWPSFLAATLASLPLAVGVLRRFRPEVVLGMGGYPSFAPIVAAALLGIPRAIHEQNATMGLANRVLSRISSRVLLSFAGTSRVPRGLDNVVVTGLPVRRGFRSKGREPEGRELVVMGGSQGSRALVEATLRAAPVLARLPDLKLRILVGKAADPAWVSSRLREAGLREFEVESYTTRMPELLRGARLVVARAGASTVAELAALGKPSVLVPWEAAAGGHQAANARALARLGGCVLLPEGELRRVDLGEFIARLWRDEDRLEEMSSAARLASRPNAAQRVAAELVELAKGRGGA